MLVALHHEIDRYLTAKFAEGMAFDIHKSIKLISDAPYYLHDRVTPRGTTQSTMLFDLARVVDLLDSCDEGTDSVYAVLPRRYLGGRRRVFSAISAIWLCHPPQSTPKRDPVWRVHTDQLVYLDRRPDITSGEEIPASLVWSEAP